jgi:hypothetical protein
MGELTRQSPEQVVALLPNESETLNGGGPENRKLTEATDEIS